ncbi:response regulator [Cupriavidus basilensis OR16]|uniref:Response regulator n=1 Tax=Cupriavidus basilensis OR16 TaxID=1127483 RepID=H1S4M3_9BURK|nr:LuxR C-terminal-related transcriptional regulator [Cupriavidus basilensis]EHP42579.1 response regulator [Cupriavidus basilensis OR16]
MNALLIEGHPLLRLGLLQMLERIHGVDHVITVDPADVALLDGNHCDLLVFGMPADTDAGWQLLNKVRSVLSAERLLLLADVLPLQIPALAMAQGICGCLPKSASLAVLEAGIRLAMVGGQYVRGQNNRQAGAPGSGSPGLSAGNYPVGGRVPMLAPLAEGALCSPAGVRIQATPSSRESVAAAARQSAAAVDAGGSGGHGETAYDEAEMLQITPRQYEVLVLLARGHPIKTVSRMLNISVATVKSHACTLYQRLKVRNKGEAVYAALQRGASLEWVSGDEAAPRAAVRNASSADNRPVRAVAEYGTGASAAMR